MRRTPLHLSLALWILASAGCVPPAMVPTRPTERLPLVELEIHNTATPSDDYVGTTAAPARIRMTNGDAVGAAVPVTLKNVDFQTTPALRFNTSGSATLATLNLTLPADGAWVPFVVAGAAGQSSARDKDAIIEVLEARPDGIVLGRKSLMVTTTPPVATTAPRVEIRIGQAPVVDDYVAWRPVRGAIRLAATGSALQVTLRNMTPMTGGRLVFGPSPPVEADVVPPAMTSTVTLTLPGDGEWVGFYVAGDYGFPSQNDKDAVLEVVRTSNNQVLGREGLMVRVRRNANGLTTDERARFLNAVARLNTPAVDTYRLYQQIHAVASGQAHTMFEDPPRPGPAFLPWHRVFVLRLERELQAVDPSVALHYWRFDQAAPTVFANDFMGSGSGPLATYTSTNPLGTWSIDGFSGVQRSPRFTATQAPAGLRTEIQTLALGGSTNAFAQFAPLTAIEGNPHGAGHMEVSGYTTNSIGQVTSVLGWMGSLDTAVRDPIFFMLHSNVDRLWAKWQWTHDRKDPEAVLSYSHQGAYAGGPSRLGHYLDDRMWPWDGTTGVQTSGDPLTQRPTVAPAGPMPASIGGWGPRPEPRPRDVINFDRWTLLGVAGLGFGYDDVPFSYTP